VNKKDKVKLSELPQSFTPACNLKEEQIVSKLQSVESADVPLCKELENRLQKSENRLQEVHVGNTTQCGASELQKSIKKGQLFVYILSPGIESWEMEQFERAPYGQNIPVSHPQLFCLAHSLQGVRISKIYCLILNNLYSSPYVIRVIKSR